MTSQSKLATVEIRTGKLPTVHVGEITPLVATQFEHGMLDYAAAKDIAADKITSLVFGCFLDQRVRNWFSPSGSREAFGKLSLADFMAKLHKKFLRPDWEIQTRASILSSRMKSDETFSEWVVVLQSMQALLVGTSHAVDDQRLRHTLEANMLSDLATDYSKHKATNAIPEDEFDTWVLAVIELDEERVYEDEKQQRRIAIQLKADKRRAADDGERPTKKATTDTYKASAAPSSKPPSASGSGSTSSMGKNCPPLTPEERQLLADNGGCNRCRVFFAGHSTGECKEDFPSGIGYRVRTQADVAAARKSKPSKAVAVIMPAVDEMEDSDDSTDELETSVSSPSRSPPSHRVDHLYWDCLIEGPMTNLPLLIQALIDNGAHLALIDELLVDKIGLRRYKLRKPEPITLAMSDGNADVPTYLTEYVKLPLLSRDQTYRSSTVRALIAPNLCSPVILGLPWLTRNSIVIDHRERSAVDKRVNYDLLNPPAPATRSRDLFEKVRPVDVVAAVQERIAVLAHWEDLAKRGEKVRADYPQLFEPMPHVDDLPDEVLCVIKVKDAERNIESRSYRSPRKYREAWQ
ncbi:hypothetical protein B0H15DRAFT_770979, partial [Mycena belliarum]